MICREKKKNKKKQTNKKTKNQKNTIPNLEVFTTESFYD